MIGNLRNVRSNPGGRWLRLLLATLFAAVPAGAQTGNPPDLIDVVFRVFRTGRGDFDDIRFLNPAGQSAILEFNVTIRSDDYRYRGNNPIVFFREEEVDGGGGPPAVLRTPVATARIPEGVDEALIIFVANPRRTDDSNAPEFSAFVMDDSLQAFPPDSLVVFNATGAHLFGRVGGRDTRFPVGPSDPFDLNRFARGRYPVAFAVQSEEGPRMVFEKELGYSLGNRVILLLQPPRIPGTFRIQARSIQQKFHPQ